MTSQAHRRSRTRPTFRQGWARSFGTSFNVPKAGPRLTITIAIMAVLVTGAAAAAWQVNDRNTQREIQDLQRDLENRIGGDGTVTGQLNDLNRKLQVSPRSGTTPDMIAEPTGDRALNASNPTNTIVQLDQLCTTGAQTPLGQQQNTLCRELAQTELAQYRFSMEMFQRAKENYDRLKEIEDRRRNLQAEDYANVQYNTNELLALTALMDNDRDRYRTYMAAYEARIAHIQNSRASLTRNALKGSGGLPSF